MRTCRTGLACALALVLLGAPAAASDAGEGVKAADTRSTVEEIAGILAMVEDEESAVPATMRLRALGPTAVPSIFAVLAHGRISEDAALSGPQREALLAALGRSAGPVLFDFLAETIPWSEDLRIRVAGLEVLRSTARAPQWRLLLASAVPAGPDGAKVLGVAPPIERAFGAAVEGMLRRDPSGFDSVSRAWPALPSALQPAVVRAVGRAGTCRGLDVLMQILASEPATAPLVMRQIPRVAEHASPGQARVLRTYVREQFVSGEQSNRQAATILAGRLRDTGSVPMLVELLSSESRGMRENALWALRAITGVQLRDDPDRWIAWHEEEQAWFEREGAAVKRDLRLEDASRIADALRRAARRPLFRDDLGPGVAAVLEHESATLRAAACRALASLGARDACPDLIPLVEDPHESVREAAHASLTHLTGLEVRPDAIAWSEALAERASSPR